MAEKHSEISFTLNCGRLLAFLLLLCSLSRVSGAVPPPGTAPIPRLTAAAQDGTGTVWALPDDNNGYDQSQSGKIYRWQTGKQTVGNWVEQSIPDAAGFHPAALTQGDDGSVYALWQKRDPGWYPGQAQAAPAPCLITVHWGIRSRVQSRFTTALPVPGPFAGPLKLYVGRGGDAWVVGDAPTLLHMNPDGTVRNFPVTPDQVFGRKFSYGFPSQAFSSSLDPLGRRWFWQTSQNFWMPGSLRGFLIWDGKTLAYHPTLPGLPDTVCTLIAPHGGRFLWAAQIPGPFSASQSSTGFYKIDTRTLTAAPQALPPAPVPTPIPVLTSKAARQAVPRTSIGRIFWLQGDLCVIQISYSGGFHVELWRRQGASWRKEPDTLAQILYNYGNQANPTPDAVLDTPQGTWLAVNGAGLDWLPASAKDVDTAVVRVNWRRGLAAGQVRDLFRLTNGQIMPFPYYGSAILPSTPPPLLPPRPGITIGTLGQPSDMGDMLADQHRHLWGFLFRWSGQQVLEEWDGRQWHAYLIPKIKSTLPTASLYACDTQGRIWTTIQLWNPPAQSVDGRLVYDPAHDSWTEYDTVPEALAAAAAEPGMAFIPTRNTSNVPIFSGDGRVAYIENQEVFLYDGKQWRQWKVKDIQPSYPYSNSPDHPQFKPNGALEVALDTHLYDWTPESGWQPNGIAPPVSPPPTTLPPGGPADYYGPLIPDNAGGGWISFGGDVYLTRYGLWRKVAALSGRGSPFYDGRTLQNVLQGPDGRYFFETTPGGFYEYVVWSPPAVLLPAPRIQVATLSADAVRLRFQAAQSGPHELQWRLNGGAWSAPLTGGGPVMLTALRPGTYRVEAQAVNSLLQASPAPSVAVFTVQPPTAAQIAAWVQALLSGSDDAREAAVTGLVKLPAAALPALHAARPGASESGQWWIDAAIQQIADQAQAETNAVR